MSAPGLTPCNPPLYTTFASVKVRLTNKVQFQENALVYQDGELPDALLAQLIVDAETKVEQDMRSRYMIPFQSIRTGRYADLPDHSQRAIRTAVDLRAVMEVLRTDFGRGTHIQGSAYYEDAEAEYKEYIVTLLGYDPESRTDERHKRFRFSPPLEDLRLAISNQFADDGYKGRIINTDASRHGAETYAQEQINNPARSYISRRTNRGDW